MLPSTASKVARWWANRLKRGDATLFAEKLYDLIVQYSSITLKTDYDPDETLLQALHEAGIECSGCMFSCDGLLPRKTILWVYAEGDREVIEVKEGYGAPHDYVV